ncbi:uncharacterized protein LOC127265003 [Andrographis paniculata]|uniref:uncharacterized protein LOC127265003 n=1 Tax=Andrographis paniculata TaxID=175694 RepID=UPI0021E9527B|nr:uncharacterized protein LOC127265003 [Andrographis paniculata]
MSKKKSKSVAFDSTTPSFGVGGCEGSISMASLKHQSLIHDYVELQKEVSGLRGSLDSAKQRKQILAAEVRFLRERHRQLSETKNLTVTHEHIAPLPKRTKKPKDQILRVKESRRNGLPPALEQPKPKKKQSIGKQVATCDTSVENIRAIKKTTYNEKDPPTNIFATTIFNKDLKERTFGAIDFPICAFDLNHDSLSQTHPGTFFPRAPIFDLNQVSTGEEDFSSNGEAAKFDPQTDLKLSICRNSGEGSSRVGKRKISWQDPVALRV